MKSLYFDLVGGIAGDMTVAALLDLGASFAALRAELSKLKLDGYDLQRSRVRRGHVSAVKFDVRVRERRNFSLNRIRRLVGGSGLNASVKKNIMRVYEVLAAAETKVHAHAHQDIAFDEVGDIDSVVDIAAVCICLNQLDCDEIFYSVIPVNNNIAPATFELFSGKKVLFTGLPFENVTPTGMSILAALGEQIEPPGAAWRLGCAGYGAGSLDSSETPNVLRVVEVNKDDFDTDEIFVLEANIDDMNPQFFDFVFEKVFAAGALDAFVENILMKKTRPAFVLKVLARPADVASIARLLLQETTTTGVRYAAMRRLKIAREIVQLRLGGKTVRVKRIQLPDAGVRFAPEYDDCKMLAVERKMKISDAYELIKKKAQEIWPFQG